MNAQGWTIKSKQEKMLQCWNLLEDTNANNVILAETAHNYNDDPIIYHDDYQIFFMKNNYEKKRALGRGMGIISHYSLNTHCLDGWTDR